MSLCVRVDRGVERGVCHDSRPGGACDLQLSSPVRRERRLGEVELLRPNGSRLRARFVGFTSEMVSSCGIPLSSSTASFQSSNVVTRERRSRNARNGTGCALRPRESVGEEMRGVDDTAVLSSRLYRLPPANGKWPHLACPSFDTGANESRFSLRLVIATRARRWTMAGTHGTVDPTACVVELPGLRPRLPLHGRNVERPRDSWVVADRRNSRTVAALRGRLAPPRRAPSGVGILSWRGKPSILGILSCSGTPSNLGKPSSRLSTASRL